MATRRRPATAPSSTNPKDKPYDTEHSDDYHVLTHGWSRQRERLDHAASLEEVATSTVEVLLAARNGELYIGQQIDSIVRQSYSNWRLLVSDDCSKDHTVEVVKSYALRDERIRLISDNECQGSAKANFIRLASASTANYVMFCDQDDVWAPTKIQLSMSAIQELERANGPGVPALVFSDMTVVNSQLEVIHPSFEASSKIDPSRNSLSQVLVQSIGAGCTMIVNRSLVDLLLLAGPSDAMIHHDWWSTLIAAGFGVIGHINAPTSQYRQHGSNAVGAAPYSPFGDIARLKSMQARVENTIRQSQSFERIYASQLAPARREDVAAYSSLLTVSRTTRLRILIRHRAWKYGALRKLGQVVSLLLLKADPFESQLRV